MSFIRNLFDLSFQEYVTKKIIKFLYVVALIGVAIFSLITFIGGLIQIGDSAIYILTIIVVPIMALVMVIALRVYFELLIIIFQVAEDVRDIAWSVTKGQKAPSAAPMPPPAPYPQYAQQPYQQYPQYPQYPQQPPQPPQPPSAG